LIYSARIVAASGSVRGGTFVARRWQVERPEIAANSTEILKERI
jgi:hypothetical protein